MNQENIVNNMVINENRNPETAVLHGTIYGKKVSEQ